MLHDQTLSLFRMRQERTSLLHDLEYAYEHTKYWAWRMRCYTVIDIVSEGDYATPRTLERVRGVLIKQPDGIELELLLPVVHPELLGENEKLEPFQCKHKRVLRFIGLEVVPAPLADSMTSLF